jgi:membrane associated rhomboid family serine protease
VEALESLSRGAPASAVLLAAIVAISLIGLYAAPVLIDRNLFRPYWLVPRGEYATLLGSGFIHADLTHLLFNAFTFWAFAFSLERHIGSARFLALYFIGLLASDAGTWFKHRGDAEYRTLGASGAILAVLFASILYFPSASIFIVPIPLPIPAPLFALAYLAYSYFAAQRGRGRVNHDAHLAGALTGIAFVAISDPQAFREALRHFIG